MLDLEESIYRVGKFQQQEKPFSDDRYIYPNYTQLTHGFHKVVTKKLIDRKGKEKYTIQLYDKKQQHQTLQTADSFLYKQLQSSVKATPEFQTISYDMKKQQSQFCRFQLEHKH